MNLETQFIKNLEVECYSPRTIKSYNFHIKSFLKFCKGKHTQERIYDYLQYLRRRNNSESTVNTAWSALIYFYQKVIDEPMRIRKPNIRRKKGLPKPVDRTVIRKLELAATTHRELLIVQFYYSTGMRRGEGIKARFDHIDWNQGLIRVDEGKGNKDRITIISKKVLRKLHIIKEQRELEGDKNPYIFKTKPKQKYGKYCYIAGSTVARYLEILSEKAKLDRVVTPHQLRHSFATHCLEDGVPMPYVQEWLGHENIETTRRYQKVMKRNYSRATNPLDNLDEGIAWEKGHNTGKHGVMSQTVGFIH